MFCEIRTPKAVYKLDIKRNITLLQGNSGTGKTYLCKAVRGGMPVGTNIKCDMPVYSVTPVDVSYDAWFRRYSDSILFIDESELEEFTGSFCKKAIEHGCRLVICSREAVSIQAEYAIDSVLVLHASGKYITAEPKYILSDQHHPEWQIITEDSSSGLDFYRHVRSDTDTMFGKDSIKTWVCEKKRFHITYLVDGAAFGRCLEPVWVEYIRGNIDIVAPESFEYVLLNSPMLYEKEWMVLNDPEAYGATSSRYYTWEQFFTDYLKKVMAPFGGYSKGKNARCFTDDCCYKDISCELARYSCTNKLQETLRNAGLGWIVPDNSKYIDELWEDIPPSLRAEYAGDREALLRRLGLL